MCYVEFDKIVCINNKISLIRVDNPLFGYKIVKESKFIKIRIYEQHI